MYCISCCFAIATGASSSASRRHARGARCVPVQFSSCAARFNCACGYMPNYCCCSNHGTCPISKNMYPILLRNSAMICTTYIVRKKMRSMYYKVFLLFVTNCNNFFRTHLLSRNLTWRVKGWVFFFPRTFRLGTHAILYSIYGISCALGQDRTWTNARRRTVPRHATA